MNTIYICINTFTHTDGFIQNYVGTLLTGIFPYRFINSACKMTHTHKKKELWERE